MTEGEPLVSWEWIASHTGVIWGYLVQHVVLTVIAVGIGLVIASLLAALALRVRAAYPPITWVTGVLYTIPSIALFALLIPFTGLSIWTAEIGLISYTLLILVGNIVAGLHGVDQGVREAAEAMGYLPARRVLTVELPLALPVILAGVRIATVTVVGLVTVTALIGQGGLGVLILDGLARFFSTPLIAGTVLSVLLALAFDAALLGIQRVLTPWRRKGTR